MLRCQINVSFTSESRKTVKFNVPNCYVARSIFFFRKFKRGPFNYFHLISFIQGHWQSRFTTFFCQIFIQQIKFNDCRSRVATLPDFFIQEMTAKNVETSCFVARSTFPSENTTKIRKTSEFHLLRCLINFSANNYLRER